MGSMLKEVSSAVVKLEVEIPRQSEDRKINTKDDFSSFSKFVIFRVGREKEKMYGLKSKLILKSQMFYEIVYARKEINHPEFTPEVFHAFLTFINSDELCVEENHVPALLRLAFLYDIPYITTKVGEFAKKTLNLDNCVKYHLAASLYELTALQATALKFILRQGQAFLTHPSFLDLDPLTLGLIISRDDFNVVETDLFRCILAWIGSECRRLHYPPDRKEFHRRVCGDLFLHIRYALMTPREFQNVVIPTGILGLKDIESVQLRHSTHPSLWHTLPPSRLLDRQRCYRTPVSIPLYNSVQFGYRRINSPNVKESVRFLASKDIFLVGIGFFGPARNNGGASLLTSFKIKYQIENEFTNYYYKTLPEHTSIVTSDDFEVELPHPYKIEGQHAYKLTVWIEGQMSQFGANPLPQAGVILNDSFISFLFSDGQADKEVATAETDSLGKLKYQTDLPGVIKCLLFQTL